MPQRKKNKKTSSLKPRASKSRRNLDRRGRTKRRASAQHSRPRSRLPRLKIREVEPSMPSEIPFLQLAAPAESAEQALPEAELKRLKEHAYREGYREGIFEGGEGIVGKLLPRYTLLPGSTAESLIAAGLKQLPEDQFVKLAGPEAVFHTLQTAAAESRPLSLIRLGDGELLTLAHEVLIPTEEAVKRGPFLPYAGVELPAPSVREALLDALRRAHLIGVPESRHPSFQGLLFPLLKHAGLSLRQLPLTTSTINFGLCEAGLMSQLLRGRRILAIGNKAEALAEVLRGAGIEVAGVIASVQGVKDVPMILDRATQVDFDIALVSAGIAAVLICVELAERKGKIALDFGHAADKLGTGELTF